MNEGFMANRFRRNQGKQDYENALAELQAARDYSQAQAFGAYTEGRGRLNNMLASSDMWGGGAAANMAIANQGYQNNLGGIMREYQQGQRASYADYQRILNEMAELDRQIRSSRLADIDMLYRDWDATAYDRWMAQQQLMMDAMNQRNTARMNMAGY
jgi:hypothetical protein